MLTTKLTRPKFQRREMKKLGKPTTRSKAVLEKTVLKVTLPELQEIEKSIVRCNAKVSRRNFNSLQLKCD